MDDSELVEFLLNDDFNKEKILLNGSLNGNINNSTSNDDDDEGKQVHENLKVKDNLDSIRIRNDNKETTVTRTKDEGEEEEEKDEKDEKDDDDDDGTESLSSAESGFLDDLDNIIMSTNTGENSKRRQIKQKIKTKEEKNEKDVISQDKPSVQNRSGSHTSDLTSLHGDSQSKIKLNDQTAIIKIQIFNNDTGKLDREENFKVSNSHKLVLKTFESKFGSKDSSDKSSSKAKNTTSSSSTSSNSSSSNSRKKLSFQFKTTESDLVSKIPNKNTDTSQVETKPESTAQKDNTSKKKRRDRKKNIRQANKTTSNDTEQRKHKNNYATLAPRNSSKEKKKDRKQANINQSSLKRKTDVPSTKLREVIDSKVPTDEYSRTTIEF